MEPVTATGNVIFCIIALLVMIAILGLPIVLLCIGIKYLVQKKWE
nr:MAG TPA: G1 Lysosomal transcription factor, NCU-G1 [Crassvirales sp.]